MKNIDSQLIDEWLKHNKPKRFDEAPTVYVKYEGPLTKINVLTPIKYDNHKKRIYKNLNKLDLSGSLDETTRFYGN